MPIPQKNSYTEDDYYALPEDARAELIDGELVYNQASPSRIHQTILSELHATIHQYIKSKNGLCHIYPAPFAVQLKEDRKTIVEPDISVICDSSKLTDILSRPKLNHRFIPFMTRLRLIFMMIS